MIPVIYAGCEGQHRYLVCSILFAGAPSTLCTLQTLSHLSDIYPLTPTSLNIIVHK